MYGIQTKSVDNALNERFENDVNMYGIQTAFFRKFWINGFENDVNMYGIQTAFRVYLSLYRLRMM